MKFAYTHILKIALMLLLNAGLATAQAPGTEFNSGSNQEVVRADTPDQSAGEQVWRFSFDQKFYTINYSAGLHVRPVSAGQLSAEVPLTTDKKGRNKLEGHWVTPASGGLIVVQGLEQNVIRGTMLVPANGNAAFACNSRKAAIFISIGQPQPVCTVESFTWTLVPNMSVEQAIQQEAQELNASASSLAAQSSSSPGVGATSVDSSYVGTWSNESSSAVSYAKTHLELRADGTYTKTLVARPASMGGGVIGAASLGDTHSGTWSVAGPSRVLLSGDALHKPYTQDLSSFTRQ
jgi:hypothetical protein